MEENVCRICLQAGEEDEMCSIYNIDDQGIKISNKIRSCCGVKLPQESDGFPTKICSKCKAFLIIAYKLRTICRNSDAYLRRFTGNVIDTDYEEDENAPLKEETEDSAKINESIENDENMSDNTGGSPQMLDITDLDHYSDIDVDVTVKHKLENEKTKPTNEVDDDSHHYECDECGRTYTRKKNLDKHKKVHRELASGVRKPPEKFGICPHCGDNFPTKSLPVHIRRHTGEKPFACDECEMRYVRRQDLIVHKRCHTGEKPHVCLTCGKAFSRANQLVRHIRVHTGERPYKCPQCDRGFAQRNDLNLHIRRHTGEKPYQCGICGESFINGTNLRNHRKITQHYEEDRRDRFEKIRVTNPRRTYRATPMQKQPQAPVLSIEQVEPEI